MKFDIERTSSAADWYWYEDGQPSGADAPTGQLHREDCRHFDEETWTWWAEVTRVPPRLLAVLPRATYPDGNYCASCLALATADSLPSELDRTPATA